MFGNPRFILPIRPPSFSGLRSRIASAFNSLGILLLSSSTLPSARERYCLCVHAAARSSSASQLASSAKGGNHTRMHVASYSAAFAIVRALRCMRWRTPQSIFISHVRRLTAPGFSNFFFPTFSLSISSLLQAPQLADWGFFLWSCICGVLISCCGPSLSHLQPLQTTTLQSHFGLNAAPHTARRAATSRDFQRNWTCS